MSVNIQAIQSMLENSNQLKKQLGLYSNNDGTNWFSMKKDGDYEVRILDIGDFSSGVHWNVLEGKEGRAGGTLRCPLVYNGGSGSCPVCELVEQMANSENAHERKQAQELKVQIRYPILLVDLNQPGKPVPRVYEAPISVVQGIMKWVANRKYGNIMDLDTGRNIVISRSKDHKGFTKYEVMPDPETSKIEIDPESIPQLREILKPRSREDIEYAIENGELPELNKSDSAEEPEQARKPSKYSKGLPSQKTRDEEQLDSRVRQTVETVPSSLKQKLSLKKPTVIQEENTEEELPEEQPAPVNRLATRVAQQPIPEQQNKPAGLSVSERLRAMRKTS